MSAECKVKRLVGCEGVPGQGPFMLLVLEVAGDHILGAKFQTYGCPAAQACGQFATEWIEGKTIEDAGSFSEVDVIAGVGQMPLGREHCPGLTVRALQRSLKSDLQSQES